MSDEVDLTPMASRTRRLSCFWKTSNRGQDQPSDEKACTFVPSFPSFVENTETRDTLLKKIFGESQKSMEAIEREEEREEKVVRLSPFSASRRRWELLMVTLLIVSYFLTPGRVAFSDGSIHAPFIIDVVFDCIFLIDIAVSFCTGYVENGILEMRRTAVCRHYLSTYFLLDLISNFPFELVRHFLTRNNDPLMIRYVRLPRMGRFFRMPRVLAYISSWQDHLSLNSNAMRIFKLTCLISIFAHVNACMQMLVAEIEGFPTEGWVSSCGLQSAPIYVQYSHSLFKALSHMLSIGYGANSPSTLPEVWVTMISMLVGASFYIVLFGIMGALVLSLDRNGALYEERMDSWRAYFRFCQLPKSLKRRIVAFHEHKYHTRKFFDEAALLAELPQSLRTDVQMFLCEELISRVPFFKACRMVVVRSLVSRMVREAFSPGDYIFFRDEPVTNLYFILNGKVQIETDDGTVLTILSSGSYFGEFALLARYHGDERTHRMANARSISCCVLYALSCGDFEDVAERFPEVVTLLETTAHSRFRANEVMQNNSSKEMRL